MLHWWSDFLPFSGLEYLLIAGFVVCFQFIKYSFSTYCVASIIDSIYPQNHSGMSYWKHKSLSCNYPCAKEMTSSAYTCSYLLRLRPEDLHNWNCFYLLALSKFLIFVWKYHFTISVHSCPIIFPSRQGNEKYFETQKLPAYVVSETLKCLYFLLLAASSFSLTNITKVGSNGFQRLHPLFPVWWLY